MKKESISHKLIFTYIATLILFVEALATLLSVLKKGILRKEVLDKRSNLGFDFKIIMKS